MLALDENTLAGVIIDWQGAAYGHRRECLEKWAKVLKVSTRKLYRVVSESTMDKKRERSDKGKRKIDNVEDYTRKVWAIKTAPPGKLHDITTDTALEIAIKSGVVPADAAEIPISTYNRVAVELGYKTTREKLSRFQAKYANQVHQFDATSSKYLYIAKKLHNGDRVLKLHHPKSHYYKNKPVPVDRERPWIYGCVDDYSGHACFQYVAAKGEAAVDGLSFLYHAWGEKENDPGLLSGIPKLLYLDNGPLRKALPIKNFFERLDVKMIGSEAYRSQARGKMERPWRTLFQMFELPLFAAIKDWQKFEITLSELNRRILNFQVRYNNMAHRYQKTKSRADVWWQSINTRGGVIAPSEESLATVFQRHERTVRGGYFSLDAVEYEVDGLVDAKVWVYEGVFSDKLVVEDQQTHKRYETKLFEPLLFGQRLQVATPAGELAVKEEREQLSDTVQLFTEPDESPNQLPVRKAGERTPENPMKTTALQQEEEPEDDGTVPLFRTQRERYEYFLKKKLEGLPVADSELLQMEEFESTALYKQLCGTYEKWENLQKREVV